MGFHSSPLLDDRGVGNEKSRGGVFSADDARIVPSRQAKALASKAFCAVGSATCAPDAPLYGYRYLSTKLGRWSSRDPIGEEAHLRKYLESKSHRARRRFRRLSLSLPDYRFVNSDSVGNVDIDGRLSWWLPGAGIGGAVIGINMLCCRMHIQDVLEEEEAWAEGVTGIPHRDTPGSTTDALLHCSAACRLAESPGSCITAGRTLRILNGREDETRRDDRIDIGNNTAGQELGRTASSTAECRSACQRALAEGGLWTYDPDNPDDVIQLPEGEFPSYDDHRFML